MPRLSDTSVPSYCKHKSSGRAVVYLDGRMIYLGPWKSSESRAEYNRIIGEWLASGRRLPTDPNQTTVAELVAAYRKRCQTYYRRPDGTPSSEVRNIDSALRPMVKLYGRTACAEFGSLALQAVRDEMIRSGWVRTQINKNIGRIKQMLKWAAAQELVPASVYHNVMVVSGLANGRSNAVESDPIRPVPIEHVEAVQQHVSRQISAMIGLQLLTGMRSGEVVTMRTGDIDRSGNLWVYRPSHHKTAHHGHTREVYLGPKAQKILKPFLKLDPHAYLFSPADVIRERREAAHARRKTPMSCGNKPGSNIKLKPLKQPGDCYTSESYWHAIKAGCDRADRWQKAGRVIANDVRIVPRWHPHQLRHSAATELRKHYGLEGTQAVLGHATLAATQIYAEVNSEKAMQIMSAVG